MIQDNASSNKIKENKYKILRMSLLLGNGENREETINNFEDASREIDAMNDSVYQKDLEGKFYDTLTLEEEEKKLAVLVDYIGGRVEQRLSLLSDFSNVTGFELMNLPPIKYYDKLDEYKERLKYIREYLENSKNITSLNEEISDLENKLNDAYLNKAQAEKQNEKDENTLLNKFNNIIKKIPEFENITLENVDSMLANITNLVEDSEKSLEIFDKSFATLNQVGISEEEKMEYASYVDSAKEAYYSNKEQEYLLRLYILFNTSETDYNKILFKRDSINDIIYDRMDLRKKLNINNNDVLNSIYDLLEKQYDNIRNQKDNIESIELFINEINTRKDKVNELEQDNQKVEILSLLREFCIIDTYDDVENNTGADNSNINSQSLENTDSNEVFNFDIPSVTDEINPINNDTNVSKSEISDLASMEPISKMPVKEEKKISEIKPSVSNTLKTSTKKNQVVLVYDANKINLDEATLKSNNVMKRVGEMLGIKVDETRIISVNAEKSTPEESKTEVNKSEIYKDDNILNDKNSNNSLDDNSNMIADLSNNNIFTNTTFDADPEINENLSATTTYQSENPLFSNSLGNSNIDEVMANTNIDVNSNTNDEFWYSNEDTPLDLNSLPDLPTATETKDPFFGQPGSDIPELEFPNLDADFNTNADKEGI